jgi:hypothetical protein
MVKFKIYDKKLQKFVNQSASDKVWKVRYKLGIWNNSIEDNNLSEMYKIMKRNDKHLELYVKIDGRFKAVSKEVIDNVIKKYKEKEPERQKLLKERQKLLKEYIERIRKHRVTRRKKRSLKKRSFIKK